MNESNVTEKYEGTMNHFLYIKDLDEHNIYYLLLISYYIFRVEDGFGSLSRIKHMD